MKVAYKGYSAIIYNSSQKLMKMTSKKEEENVPVLCRGVRDYLPARRESTFIISHIEMREGKEYGLLSMQSAVMLGCKRPTEDNWVILRRENNVYFEECSFFCSTYILFWNHFSFPCLPNSPCWQERVLPPFRISLSWSIHRVVSFRTLCIARRCSSPVTSLPLSRNILLWPCRPFPLYL